MSDEGHYTTRLLLTYLFLAALVACVFGLVGCDEGDLPGFEGIEIQVSATPGTSTRVPDVHGVVKVSPSPGLVDPFEIRFKEEQQLPSPTPVEW